MTDTELNETIARRMGWTKNELWHSPRDGAFIRLPDFLDPKRLPDLVDLADEVLEEWDFNKRHGCYAARRNMDGDVTAWQVEVTLSLALAYAIVGYAKSDGLPHPTTQSQVTITCPAPPGFQP